MKRQFTEKEIEDAQSHWELGKCNDFVNINIWMKRIKISNV